MRLRRRDWLAGAMALSAVPPARAAEALYRRGNDADPETLDPHRSSTVAEAHILRDLGDGLLTYDNCGAIIPGAVISVRPVGVLVMQDDGGEDEKIIAVPSRKLTQRYNRVENYTDLPEITVSQIQHFFEHYKDLEPGKWVKIVRWGDRAEAERLILEGIERYNKSKA